MAPVLIAHLLEKLVSITPGSRNLTLSLASLYAFAIPSERGERCSKRGGVTAAYCQGVEPQSMLTSIWLDSWNLRLASLTGSTAYPQFMQRQPFIHMNPVVFSISKN